MDNGSSRRPYLVFFNNVILYAECTGDRLATPSVRILS